MDRQQESITKTLEAYTTTEGSHFNDRSGLILLDGPRGPLLARYVEPATPPDPDRFKFLTCYPRNYTTFDGVTPPDQMKADITATAEPVERTLDKRMGVASGATGDPISGSVKKELSTLVTPGIDSSDELTEAAGIESSPTRTDVRGSDAGIAVGDKVRVSGGFEQPSTQSKGVTRESPLFGIIPKTAVTFAAADYLPDLKRIQQLRQYVQMIRRLPSLVQKVIRISKKLT